MPKPIPDQIDVEDFALKNNLMIEGLIELLLAKGLIDRGEFVQIMVNAIEQRLHDLTDDDDGTNAQSAVVAAAAEAAAQLGTSTMQ